MSKDLAYTGAHFLVGLSGTSLLDGERKLLKSLKPAGIIIFSHNIDKTDSNWPEKLRSLTTSAQEASCQESFFISVDHEGGRVHRLVEPVAHFPPAKSWQNDARQVGRVMGRELRSLSFNLNFAPVLDVHTEKKNEVIGDRAFSATKEEVAQYGKDFVQALEAEGVLACGKHFPGHGATIADSHLELPVLDISKDTLIERELFPFKTLIDSGISMLMTAHVLYPQLDGENPATTSSHILRDLLRDELSYSKVIISDALEMKALAGMELKEAVRKALSAGVDILLVGNPDNIIPLEQAADVAQSLLEALDKGEVKETVLLESRRRISAVFEHLKSIAHEEPLAADNVLGCVEHQALLRKLKG